MKQLLTRHSRPPSFLRKQESIWKARIDRRPDGFPLARE
jgi:hypothetical protein